MRSCLRTHVLLSALYSPDAAPQLIAPLWTGGGWAGWTSGHTNGPEAESTIQSSVKSRKPANIRGKLGSGGDLRSEERPQTVLSARAKRRCRAASKRMTAPATAALRDST